MLGQEEIKPNENNCKSICYKYKTKKGYLCEKPGKQGLIDKRKWCKINENDVNIENEIKLGKLDKNNDGDYWDYISEENSEGLCYINNQTSGNIYKNCTLVDRRANIIYMFALFICALVPPLAVGSPHFIQTIQLANMSNKAFLQYLLGKFNNLIKEKYVNNGLLDSNEVDTIINEFREKMKSIDESDTNAIGQFIKDIFIESRELMQKNAETYGTYALSVTNFLIEKIPTQHLLEALRGANFVVEDNGEIYEYTKNDMLGYARFSSHAKNETGVPHIGNTELLTDAYLHLLSGTFKYEDGKVVSWFQLEGAPMPAGLTTPEVFSKLIGGRNIAGMKEYIDHFVDSIYYFGCMTTVSVIGGQAINLALGKSYHTDKNPIYIFPSTNEPVAINKLELNEEFSYEMLNNAFTRTVNSSYSIQTAQFVQGQLNNNTQMNLPSSINSTRTSPQIFLPRNNAVKPFIRGLTMGGKYKIQTKKIAKHRKHKNTKITKKIAIHKKNQTIKKDKHRKDTKKQKSYKKL